MGFYLFPFSKTYFPVVSFCVNFHVCGLLTIGCSILIPLVSGFFPLEDEVGLGLCAASWLEDLVPSHSWADLDPFSLVVKAVSWHVFRGGCRLIMTLGILSGFNNFGARVVFSLDAFHFSPPCILAILPLLGYVTNVVVTRACTRY